LKPLVNGLKNATAVAVGPDGRVSISCAGEGGKVRDGEVTAVRRPEARWPGGVPRNSCDSFPTTSSGSGA